MKRIVVKLSGMPSGLPARPATTRSLSATSCEYRQRLMLHHGRRDRNGHRPGQLVYGAMQAHHQGHLRR